MGDPGAGIDRERRLGNRGEAQHYLENGGEGAYSDGYANGGLREGFSSSVCSKCGLGEGEGRGRDCNGRREGGSQWVNLG